MAQRSVSYKMTGGFPAAWEDLICLSGDAPHVTIEVLASARYEDPRAKAGARRSPDGWLDIVVDVPVLDEDIARLAVADALGIEDPEAVKLVESSLAIVNTDEVYG